MAGEPEEVPYKDGFGTWQIMVPQTVPPGERASVAAQMITEVLEGPVPDGGVQVRSLGPWTSYEHFTEETP